MNLHTDFWDLPSVQLIPLWNSNPQIPAAISPPLFQFQPPQLSQITFFTWAPLLGAALRHKIRWNVGLTQLFPVSLGL